MRRVRDDEQRFRDVAARHATRGGELDAQAIALEAKVSPSAATLFLKRLNLKPGRPKALRAEPAAEPSRNSGASENPVEEMQDDGDVQGSAGQGVGAAD